MEDVLYKLIATVEEVAPHVWAITVRQAYVEGYIALLDSLFCLIGIVLAIRCYTWSYRIAIKTDSDENPLPILGVIFSVIAIIVLPFVLWLNLDVALAHLLNPEYAAIKLLLEAAGVK